MFSFNPGFSVGSFKLFGALLSVCDVIQTIKTRKRGLNRKTTNRTRTNKLAKSTAKLLLFGTIIITTKFITKS